jgi:hypothetical protein
MKTYHLPVGARRKSLGLTLLLALGLPALPAVTFAQDMSSTTNTTTMTTTTASTLPETDKSMADYVQWAGQQLDAYRVQINVDPPLPREDSADKAKDKLTRCDELLTRLKEANADHFDAIKAKFEAARADLAQQVQDATRPL